DGPAKLDSLLGGVASGGVPIGSDFITYSVSVVDISGDGRAVAFVTDAALLSNDLNGDRDVYVARLDDNLDVIEYEIVSRSQNAQTGEDTANAAGGVLDPNSGQPEDYHGNVVRISEDGRYVAYVTENSHTFQNQSPFNLDPDGGVDLYLRDTLLDRTLLVSDGMFVPDVQNFDISADASRIVFSTFNALDEDDANGALDVYLAEIDLASFTVADYDRVSEAEGGFELGGGDSFSPTISPDGTRVAFQSNARDIVPLDPANPNGLGRPFEIDLETGEVKIAFSSYRGDAGASFQFNSIGYDLSNEAMAFRGGTGVGADTIKVGASIDPPNEDVPNDGSVSLSAFRGEFVRSDLSTFDTDVYQIFDGSSGFSVSAEGAGKGVGTHENLRIRVRENAPNGTVVAEDQSSGFGDDAFIRFGGGTASAYFVEVSSVNSFIGGVFNLSNGSYRLRVDFNSATDDIDTPLILALDTPQDESISSSTRPDWFQFEAEQGQRYTVTVTERTTNPLEAQTIRIRDAQGDLSEASSFDANTFTFTADFSGLGFVEIDATSNANAGAYTVEIEEADFPIVIFPLGAPEEPDLSASGDFIF
ncbi:MAG: hypothetical protein AAFU55_08670, partial [Pseudomonadota bacterium]